MLRVCKKCNQEKNLVENFTRRLDSCKNITYRWDCKSCTNKLAKEKLKDKECSIENCKNIVCAKNLCNTHYGQISDSVKISRKKYWKSNKGKVLSKNNQNRRRDRFEKCSMFSFETKNIYRKCLTGMAVDHIIPIIHEDVCGLHVPWNLQYLTISENSKKKNSFDYTYDNISWRQDIIVEIKKVA